jgi:hypothetical protein
MTAVVTVEKALLPHCGLFGAPMAIVSDNGKQFSNDIIKEFHELVGTEEFKITPYSHEENSLVERYHKETLRHLRALCWDKQTKDEFSIYTPLVQRIINASHMKAIGCSPTQMLFGDMIDTNRGIFLEFSTREKQQLTTSQYMSKLIDRQAFLVNQAQKLLEQHEAKHLSQLRKAPITEYPRDSFVLVSCAPGALSRPATKLHFP